MTVSWTIAGAEKVKKHVRFGYVQKKEIAKLAGGKKMRSGKFLKMKIILDNPKIFSKATGRIQYTFIEMEQTIGEACVDGKKKRAPLWTH